MQRMYNLSKWLEVKEGDQINFTGSRPRTVRLEVNAPGEVALYVLPFDDLDQDGEPLFGSPIFLALVKGRDVIEFSPDGAFAVTPEGGSCYFQTADGDVVHVEVVAPVSFTKIVERRRRDPVLEQMMYEAQRNAEKRMAIMLDQQAAMFNAALVNQATVVPPAAPAVPAAPVTPPADGGSEAASETPPPAGGTNNAGE